jgi:hypothetical protein
MVPHGALQVTQHTLQVWLQDDEAQVKWLQLSGFQTCITDAEFETISRFICVPYLAGVRHLCVISAKYYDHSIPQ